MNIKSLQNSSGSDLKVSEGSVCGYKDNRLLNVLDKNIHDIKSVDVSSQDKNIVSEIFYTLLN